MFQGGLVKVQDKPERDALRQRGVGIRKRLWRRYGRNDRRMREGGVCEGTGERSCSPKKPISCNDEPSSDAPQTKQTKQPIRLIVRDIPRLHVCVCADEGTLCGQQLSQH